MWKPNRLLAHDEWLGMLVLAAGLDNVPGSDLLGQLVPPCGPDELSNTRHLPTLYYKNYLFCFLLF